MRVDIFCKVIDNWGDAGVCWRLARQWQHDYGAQVRLIIDAPHILNAWRTDQVIDVQPWSEHITPRAMPHDGMYVIIEAFACELPAHYIEAWRQQAQHTQPPHWYNLEYLSAEAWVDSHHLLPSPQSGGLNKYFFFPGFSAHAGGLLREHDLIQQREQFTQKSPQAWQQYTSLNTPESALKITLFGYEHMPLGAWLPALITSEQPIHIALTHGKASSAFTQAWTALGYPAPTSQYYQYKNLHAHTVPMLSQTQYDELLWSSDINFVRGEDSLVRAIWAGKPLVWDIYKQDDNIHHEKLSAFIQKYDSKGDMNAWQDWQKQWNQEHVSHAQIASAWQALMEQLPQLNQHTQRLCTDWANTPDLLSQLMQHITQARNTSG